MCVCVWWAVGQILTYIKSSYIIICRREPLCKAWSVSPIMYGAGGFEVLTAVLLTVQVFRM